jgi:hypothetical protein
MWEVPGGAAGKIALFGIPRAKEAQAIVALPTRAIKSRRVIRSPRLRARAARAVPLGRRLRGLDIDDEL